ncbi:MULTISPECIES: ribosome maturation factor RimM [Prevotella]|uniref:Ribosome maturation factor RimM n=1 Tax=Prevotella herbatica TaxID=2801997 RepID=A0ABN6EI95_9BACT|nr:MULTISPECIES: ribosome maturation factor RimM [Prevotella]MDN5553227.1 ribosome maturation factor RimM [Prevotella sp.]BCS85598.1 ribosome maturation factor RimM [Prevotella herbatica]
MIRREEVYKIGKLGKPHGVKGEISFMFDDDVFDRVDADYLILDVDGILVPFFIEEYRFRSDEIALVKFEDIDTQDKARDLTGDEIYFPRSLSDGGDENVSWAEIFGFEVVDKNTNKTIGIIKSVDDSTINTLFEIETNDGKDVLIPANEDLIHEADMENRRIKMFIPEGLLDL